MEQTQESDYGSLVSANQRRQTRDNEEIKFKDFKFHIK